MSTPTAEAIIGTFINGRSSNLDFLQLKDNHGGNIFGWIDAAGHLQGSLLSGVGTPGGSNQSIQFNNSGSFGGATNFLYNSGTGVVTLNGSTVATQLPYGVDTGAANAYVVNPSTAATLTLGSTFNFSTTNPNSGASTLNASGLGIKNITNEDGSALVTGDIIANVLYSATYDGTEWILGGYNSVPASSVSFNGSIVLVSEDPGTGFLSTKGAPLTLVTKNTPASRNPLIAFGNPAGASGAFFGFDNDNVFVCGTAGCRIAFLSGTNPEIFDLVSIVQNTSFGGDDLFIQPSLGGGNKLAGSMLNVLSGDGNSQFTFTYQNVILLDTLKAATNVANQNSPVLEIGGTYWTGSVSAADMWSLQVSLGSGANPSSTLNVTHSGSSGSPLFNLGSTALTCGNFISSGISMGGPITFTVAAATGGGNVNSYSETFDASWWDGSAAHTSATTIQEIMGSGTNPTTDTLTISNSGSHAWSGVSILGALSANTLTATSGTPTGGSGTLSFGTTTGVGNGAGTNLQAPAHSTGTGPSTLTAVLWNEIDIAGTKYWYPLYQ